MKNILVFRPAQSLVAVSANLRPAAANPKCSFRAALLGTMVLLGATAWSSPAQAQTQPAPAVHTKQGDAESLWLTIENPAKERVQVRVVQLSNRNCLSNEINHQSSYGCKLSFGKLPTGQYDVVLRVGHERYRYAVQVQAQALRSTISSVHDQNGQPFDKAVASVSR